MSIQTLMTAVEFEKIAGRLGPCELVRGEVINLSPAGFSHSQITVNIVSALSEWRKQTASGRILAGEMGIVVEQGPDTVRGADVVYYSYKRLPKNSAPQGFSAVAPDLIVEVVGKGQGWREMVQKVGEYLRMGVDRVWIVDPKTQRVHIYRSDAEPVVLNPDDSVADEVVLPGFTCKVAEFFAD